MAQTNDPTSSDRDHPDDGGGRQRRCPVCEAPVSGDSTSAPFCSPRCRLVDLGKWLSGEYTISRELRETDLDDPDRQ